MDFKEVDLYVPVKYWLEQKGCVVKAEVLDLDVMGIFDSEITVAIELKKTLNLEVINQAVNRQRLVDMVYIAVKHDFKAIKSQRYKRTQLTLRRLNLGLITVNFRANPPQVHEIVKAEPFDFNKSRSNKKKHKDKLIKEFNMRSGDYNQAGVNRSKIMTGYKEVSLLIAVLLNTHGPLSPKQLKLMGSDSKMTSSILINNYNGWFDRISRGIYVISEIGKEALVEHQYIVSYITSNANITLSIED